MRTTTFLNTRVTSRIRELLPKDLIDAMIATNGYLAGGALTSLFTRKPIADWDIYFRSPEDIMQFRQLLVIPNAPVSTHPGAQSKLDLLKSKRHSRKTPQVVFVTPNAISFLYKELRIQIITAFTMDPEHLFDKFDFTVCMCSWMPANNSFEASDKFFEHIAERRLVVNVGTEYPICSLVRVFKYQVKGYFISGTDIIVLALAIHALKLETYAELKRQLEGIDTLFLKGLTDLLISDEYKDKTFDFSEFLRVINDYISTAFIDEHYGSNGIT